VKIQKGILAEPTEKKSDPAPIAQTSPIKTAATPAESFVEKNRLFETLDKEETSSRSYAKLLLISAVAVLIAGGVIFYMMLPGVGDKVRAPTGLEQAVRDHLQDKQKRVATGISFYYCGGNAYWAHSGVETRKDIPNPIYKLDSYAVSAKGEDPNWEITSKPIQSPADDKPCS
jgi:hypothetical protein